MNGVHKAIVCYAEAPSVGSTFVMLQQWSELEAEDGF